MWRVSGYEMVRREIGSLQFVFSIFSFPQAGEISLPTVSCRVKNGMLSSELLSIYNIELLAQKAESSNELFRR
jgi:hypothetical protein